MPLPRKQPPELAQECLTKALVQLDQRDYAGALVFAGLAVLHLSHVAKQAEARSLVRDAAGLADGWER